LNYPPKLIEQPFWFTTDYKTFKDFRLWTWLQATKTLDLPITEKAETWYNYFSIEGNQIKAKELLDPFSLKTRSSLTSFFSRNTKVYTQLHAAFAQFTMTYLINIPLKTWRSILIFKTLG
jgi:hypothetical protein